MSTLYHGDCLEVLPTLAADSVDAVVTDPPYHLTSGNAVYDLALTGAGNPRVRRQTRGGGFMGKAWDGGGVAFDPATWAAVLRVAKPGAHLVAFGGTRTYHRMACAIEDAGWEIRDCIAWLFGSGFPKRHDMLKPGYEPIVVARNPAKGARGFNVDACRLETAGRTFGNGSGRHGGQFGGGGISSHERGEWIAQQGRWPANVILDEEAAVLLDEQSGELNKAWSAPRRPGGAFAFGAEHLVGDSPNQYGDSGGASRFFYTAKADTAERNLGLAARNSHPTVKPVDLMGWLIRLVTPPGGVVLDPFLGSGTTAIAAIGNGFDWIGIEREAEYVAIAEQRIGLGCQAIVA